MAELIEGYQWVVTFLDGSAAAAAQQRKPFGINAAGVSALWTCESDDAVSVGAAANASASAALLASVDDGVVAAAAAATAGANPQQVPRRLAVSSNRTGASDSFLCASTSAVFANAAVAPLPPPLPPAPSGGRVYVYTRDASSAAPGEAGASSAAATGVSEEARAVAGSAPPRGDALVPLARAPHGSVRWSAQVALAAHSAAPGGGDESFGVALALSPDASFCLVGAPARSVQGYAAPLADAASANSSADAAAQAMAALTEQREAAAVAVADGRAGGAAVVFDLNLLKWGIADTKQATLNTEEASSAPAGLMPPPALAPLPHGLTLSLLPAMQLLSGAADLPPLTSTPAQFLGYAVVADGDNWGGAPPPDEETWSGEAPPQLELAARGRSLVGLSATSRTSAGDAADLHAVIGSDRPLTPRSRLAAASAHTPKLTGSSSITSNACLESALAAGFSTFACTNCSTAVLARAAALVALAHAAGAACTGAGGSGALGGSAVSALAHVAQPLDIAQGATASYFALTPAPLLSQASAAPAIVHLVHPVTPTAVELHVRAGLPGLYPLPGGSLWRTVALPGAAPTAGLAWLPPPSAPPLTRGSSACGRGGGAGRAVALARSWAAVGCMGADVLPSRREKARGGLAIFTRNSSVNGDAWAEVPLALPEPAVVGLGLAGVAVAAWPNDVGAGGGDGALVAAGAADAPAVVILKCAALPEPACVTEATVAAPADAVAAAELFSPAAVSSGAQYYRPPRAGDGFGARGALALAIGGVGGAGGPVLAVGCSGLEAVFIFRRQSGEVVRWIAAHILRVSAFTATSAGDDMQTLPPPSAADPPRSPVFIAAGFGAALALTQGGTLAVGAPRASGELYAALPGAGTLLTPAPAALFNVSGGSAPQSELQLHAAAAEAAMRGGGAVVIFQDDGTGRWLQQAVLWARGAGAHAGEMLGAAIAADGDSVVAGSPQATRHSFAPAAGAAYIFTRRRGYGRISHPSPLCGGNDVSARAALQCVWGPQGEHLRPRRREQGAGARFGTAVAVDDTAGVALVADATDSKRVGALIFRARREVPATACDGFWQVDGSGPGENVLCVATITRPRAWQRAAHAAITLPAVGGAASALAMSGGAVLLGLSVKARSAGSAAVAAAVVDMSAASVELVADAAEGMLTDDSSAEIATAPTSNVGGASSTLIVVAVSSTECTDDECGGENDDNDTTTDSGVGSCCGEWTTGQRVRVPLHRWTLPAVAVDETAAVSWATVDGTALGVDAAAVTACCALSTVARAAASATLCAAVSQGDFVRAAGTVYFKPGQTQPAEITVRLLPRCARIASGASSARPPPSATFDVRLFAPSGVVIDGAAHAATIRIDFD